MRLRAQLQLVEAEHLVRPGARVVREDDWTWDPDNKSDCMRCTDGNMKVVKEGGSTEGARGTRGFSRREGGVHEWILDWQAGQGTNSMVVVCTDDLELKATTLTNLGGDDGEALAMFTSARRLERAVEIGKRSRIIGKQLADPPFQAARAAPPTVLGTTDPVAKLG